MTVADLEFAPRYVAPILRGEKTVTLRYDGEGLEAGIPLRLIRADTRRPFGTAVVDVVGTASATAWAETDIPGHRNYADVWELLDHLGEHYPAELLTPTTDLTAVGFYRTIPTAGADLEEGSA